MRMRHNAESGKTTTIATKVTLADKVRLCRIADGFNMSLYELLQALLLGIVRYFDKGQVITYEDNSLLNAIGNIIFATQDSFSPMALKYRNKQRVCKSILFLQREAGQRPQVAEVHTDNSGNIIESYNYDTMLSAFLGSTDPDVLQLLEDETKRLGYFSITHTLHELMLQRSASAEDTIAEDVAELFSDIRIPTGQSINDDVYYKRKLNRGDGYSTITRKQTYRVDV